MLSSTIWRVILPGRGTHLVKGLSSSQRLGSTALPSAAAETRPQNPRPGP
jgi:hypothetical protein